MSIKDFSDLKDALKEKKQTTQAQDSPPHEVKEDKPSEEFTKGLAKNEIPQEEEEISFLDVMAGVKPIKQDKIPKKKEKIDPNVTAQNKARIEEEKVTPLSVFLSTEYMKFVEPNQTVGYKTAGVQFGVFRKLKAGEYLPQDMTDLHGSTVEKAYYKVRRLINRALENNLRCVIIIHGKGEFSKPKALLKSYVVHWLKLMPEVIAFHTAMPYHGDKGATYVLLKKGENSRDETREIMAKRR